MTLEAFRDVKVTAEAIMVEICGLSDETSRWLWRGRWRRASNGKD